MDVPAETGGKYLKKVRIYGNPATNQTKYLKI
jgi:hypothetical protein